MNPPWDHLSCERHVVCSTFIMSNTFERAVATNIPSRPQNAYRILSHIWNGALRRKTTHNRFKSNYMIYLYTIHCANMSATLCCKVKCLCACANNVKAYICVHAFCVSCFNYSFNTRAQHEQRNEPSNLWVSSLLLLVGTSSSSAQTQSRKCTILPGSQLLVISAQKL